MSGHPASAGRTLRSGRARRSCSSNYHHVATSTITTTWMLELAGMRGLGRFVPAFEDGKRIGMRESRICARATRAAQVHQPSRGQSPSGVPMRDSTKMVMPSNTLLKIVAL
jgi:hypothetical protein